MTLASPRRTPQHLWETALGQLELQVTRPNFETWLRHTVAVRLSEDTLVVGAPSDFAVEWLRLRLSPLIDRTVSQLAGTRLTVVFQVLGAPVSSPASSVNGALPDPGGHPLPAIDPRLTFETFIVLNSNRLAYRAARRVASGDARYRPLLLYSAPGLGKTHLLHAIAHAIIASGRRVLALTGEAFVDRFTKAIRRNQPEAFRDLFQNCQAFLLDDVQFLATRPASQEQFFHILDALQPSACTVVLTADTPPDQLSGLSPRLRSRLQAGLAAELLVPTTEELAAVLHEKAQQHGIALSQAILDFMIQQPYQSIRELEGAVNRLAAFTELSTSSLSLPLAQEALAAGAAPPGRPSTQAVLRAVCDHFKLSLDQLTSPSRARAVTYARHIAMYLLREQTSLPYAEIGRLLGGRDHSTVLSGCQRITLECTSLPQTQADLQQLSTRLTHGAVA